MAGEHTAASPPSDVPPVEALCHLSEAMRQARMLPQDAVRRQHRDRFAHQTNIAGKQWHLGWCQSAPAMCVTIPRSPRTVTTAMG